jgi:hypothetical protein
MSCPVIDGARDDDVVSCNEVHLYIFFARSMRVELDTVNNVEIKFEFTRGRFRTTPNYGFRTCSNIYWEVVTVVTKQVTGLMSSLTLHRPTRWYPKLRDSIFRSEPH